MPSCASEPIDVCLQAATMTRSTGCVGVRPGNDGRRGRSVVGSAHKLGINQHLGSKHDGAHDVFAPLHKPVRSIAPTNRPWPELPRRIAFSPTVTDPDFHNDAVSRANVGTKATMAIGCAR
jgi:hypothetical protein